MSDLKQGVTLEVMGEGRSMGPWNERLKAEVLARQGDIKYDIEWTTLGEYMEYLTTKGISPNVASYVGATTVRIHEVGYDKPQSDCRRAVAHAGPGAGGDVGRRARCRLLADLRTRQTLRIPMNSSPLSVPQRNSAGHTSRTSDLRATGWKKESRS